ncbi:MAG: ABC transporter substrate-binding protein, partial [bacterium]
MKTPIHHPHDRPQRKREHQRPRISRRAFLAATGAAAAGLHLPGFAAEEKKLNFYNWDTYIGETTLDDFKKASGIEVKMDFFGDNAELFAKIREGNPGYDVIMPSGEFVERMWRADLLEKLDHGAIPNFRKNIDQAFHDAVFDPGRAYSIPYMWGTMGIGYRKSKVARPDSWSSVWGPDSDQHKGQIGWISEGSSMIGMAMRYLGHSF